MKRFSDKIRPISLSLAFLMPVIFNSALLAEVVPEVLVAERKEESDLDDDIKQLKKEAEEAEKLQKYSKAIDLYKRILEFRNQMRRKVIGKSWNSFISLFILCPRCTKVKIFIFK